MIPNPEGEAFSRAVRPVDAEHQDASREDHSAIRERACANGQIPQDGSAFCPPSRTRVLKISPGHSRAPRSGPAVLAPTSATPSFQKIVATTDGKTPTKSKAES